MTNNKVDYFFLRYFLIFNPINSVFKNKKRFIPQYYDIWTISSNTKLTRIKRLTFLNLCLL